MFSVCILERHHRVIRRYVNDRANTTSIEKGLVEYLVAHALRNLEIEPIADGFIDPHAAPIKRIRTIQQFFNCIGANVTTCVEVRSQSIRFHRGDVAGYTDSNSMLFGEIVFAASLEWEPSAFIIAWSPVSAADADEWRYTISDDIVRVPVKHLVCTVVAFIGEHTAQIIKPPIAYCA